MDTRAKLRTVKVLANEEQHIAPQSPESHPTCAICFDDLDTCITKLPCNHVYHSVCYSTFLAHELRVNTKDTIICPLCRRTILQIVVESPGTRESSGTLESPGTPESPSSRNIGYFALARARCNIVCVQLSLVVLFVLIANLIRCKSFKFVCED
jgi:hypothetical protein